MAWHQDMTWTNANILANGLPGKKTSKWNLNQNAKLLFKENVFENIVCKMVAILFGAQWVMAFIDGLMQRDVTPLLTH